MHLDALRLRPAALLSAVLALGAISGCASLGSRFPSHDEVFIPVPLTVGELRVEGTDTAYVLTGPGYELRSKDRGLLTDAQSAIDRTQASFARYFLTEPPRIRVVLKSVSRKGPRPDSASAASDGWPRTVTVFVWKAEGRDREMMGSGVRDESVSLPVARAWLTIVTDSAAQAARARLVSGTSEDTILSPRAPGWIMSAMTTLIAGTPDPDLLIAALSKHPDRLVPLRTLIAAPAPEFGRSPDERARGVPNGRADEMGGQRRGGMGSPMGRGSRASVELTGAMLMNAEATSVAEYLSQREGRPFVGHLALALSSGARFQDLIADGRTVQHDLDAFERDWKSWVQNQGSR